jgi:SAM-dependent methyltransferase
MSSLNYFLSRASDLIAELVCDKDCDPESFSLEVIRNANDTLWKISEGLDADYSLPGVGRLYSSWYHVRRIRTSRFALENLRDKNHIKSVIDLGCGTGSVAWALASLGWDIEQYVGIDSSEPMLRWAELLWQSKQEVPGSSRKHFAKNWIKSDFLSAMRYGNFGSLELGSCDLLILSHLLDNESKKRLESNTKMLNEIISFLNPKAVICTSTPVKTRGMRKLIDDICDSKSEEYPIQCGGQKQIDMSVARELLFEAVGLTLGGFEPLDGYGDSQVIISNRNYNSGSNTSNNNRRVYKLAEKMGLSNRTLLKHITEQICGNSSSLHFASELQLGLIETLCKDLGKNFNKMKVT